MVWKSFLSKNQYFGKENIFSHWKSPKYLEKFQDLADLAAIWTPPYEKNKLLLNEYLGDFMHFETLYFFFSVEMGLTPPPKVWKIPLFFFLTLPLGEV